MGHFTAQKLDHVTSTMCWCIVLMEDKHISSNAADHWQQFLHRRNGNALVLIKEVNLCWARLALGLVTVSGFDSRGRHYISIC